MSTLYILVFGLCMVLIGRFLLKSWINHLTIYSFLWTSSIALYTLKYVRYYNIITEAWIFIFTAWIMIYLGSICVLTNRAIHTIDNPTDTRSNEDYNVYLPIIKKILIIFTVLAFIGIMLEWLVLLHQFNSIASILTHGTKIYYLRVKGLLETKIPYLPSMYLVALFYGGLYTAIKRRITLLGILPLILSILQSIGAMGRSTLLISLVIYLTPIFIFQNPQRNASSSISKKRYFAISFIVFVCLTLTAEFVRVARLLELGIKRYFISSLIFDKLLHVPLLSPSIYIYSTGPLVTFSEYLKKGGDINMPGWYTFAPVYHFMSKLGLIKIDTYYQSFYLTPVPINTGTFLREFHTDFGLIGIIAIPFILSVLITHSGLQAKSRITSLVLYTYFMMIIIFSFSFNPMQLGSWLITLIINYALAFYLEKKNPG